MPQDIAAVPASPAAVAPGTRPTRLLIVSDAWRPQVNGVVRTLSTVAAELQAMGHVVDVIGPDRFRTVPMPTYPDIRLAMLPGRHMGSLIESAWPEAMHIATEGPLGLAARRWALRRGCAFTTAFHTRFPEYLAARTRVPLDWSYAWLRWFHSGGQGMMVATSSLAEELTARGFRRIMPWTRGVDLTLFTPDSAADSSTVPAADHAGLDRPVFAYIGRIAVEKNIRAFLDLDLPGSKLVVGDGPQLAELRRNYPAVRFVGARSGAALAAAYARSDVMVFPSRTDTFGLVLLESLACGTPVAAYPVTGPKDVLADAEPGVGAMDADLRTACLRAWSGADRAACRRHAQRFSWRACAELFLSHLVPFGGH